MQQSTLPAQVGPVTTRTRCREHQQYSSPRFQHRLDLSPLVQDAGTTNNTAVHASSTGWTCHRSYKMQGAPTMQQSTLPAQVGPVITRTRCRDHQQCSSPRFQHRLDLSPLIQDVGTTTNNAAVHASSTGWTCHHSYKMQGPPTMQQSTLPAQVGPVTARTRCREHQQCSGPRFQHRLDLSPLVQDVGTTNNAAVHASSTGWTCHRSYKMQGPPTMQRSTLPAQVGPVTTRTRCRDHQQCSSPRFQHRLDLSPLVQDAGSTNNAAVHASSTGWTCHHSYKITTRTGTTNNAAVHASSTGWTCHHSYKMQGPPTMQQSTLPAQVGPVTARTRCRDHQQCSSPRFQHRLDLSPLVQDAGTTNNAAVHASSTGWTCHQLVQVTARTRCRDHQQCSGPRFQHRLDLSPLVQDVGTTNNAAVHASSTGWTCHHSYKMQGAPTMQQSTLPAQVGPVTTRTRCRDHQQCSSPRFQHRLDLSPLVQDAGTTNNAAVHASSTGWTCHHSYKMQGPTTMQQSTLPAQVGPVTAHTRCRDHQQCSSPRFQHRLDLSPLVQDAGSTNNAAVHASSTGWTCHHSYKM